MSDVSHLANYRNDVNYRAEVYLLLAKALKEPVPEILEQQEMTAVFLIEAIEALGYAGRGIISRPWPFWPGDISGLRAAFHESFLYPVETRVVPVESVYRQWVQEKPEPLSFARDTREKEYLLSDAAVHMKALYQIYGRTIPADFAAVPDHLCLELEFAAFLSRAETPARLRSYLREHLDWTRDLSADAERVGLPLFYRELIGIIWRFVQCEIQNLSGSD